MGGALPPSVTPAAATAVAAPATPAPVTAEATVVKLPERLPEVTRPVVLTGTVAGQTPEGLTRVRTAAGELLLDSKAELPPDKPVTVQITPGASTQTSTAQATIPAKPTALILLQALGTPAGTAAGGTAAATPAGSPVPGNAATPAVLLPTPTPTATPALPPLMPGTVVPALVIAGGSGAKPTPAAPAGGAALQPAAPSPTGTNPVGPAKPDAAAPAMPAPATPAMPAPPMMGGGSATFGTPVQLGGDAAHPGAGSQATPDPPSRTAAGTAAEPPDLPRGATVALKILTVTPPPQQPRPPGDPEAGGRNGQGGSPTGGNQAGGNQAGSQAAGQPPLPEATDPTVRPDTPVLRGTVAGSTPQGQPILATKQGMLALNVSASLPPGAKVTAALTDLAQATQAAAPTLPGPPGPLGERDWPAMRQLMATLAASDPALAKSMLATMPQPNRKLTAALGFFLAAMRGGDARGWLGDDASSALDKAGRRDLLDRLEKDFEGLRREAAEPLPGDWRSYTIPLMDSTGPKPIRLHVHPLKEDEEGDGKPRGKPGSRFLIDLDLSRFGPMQLDGLVRPNHFDLILRSHAALPPELRVELIQVFADSVRAVGYSGGLSFQSGARSWVKLTRAGQAGLGVSA